MNFLNIIIAIYLITQIETESNAQSINSESLEDNIIERVQIDLKSKIQASGKENGLEINVYNNSIDLSRYDIKMSRLHSNQLNEKSINSFFKIANKTNILFLNDGSNRAKLNIKSCDKQFYAQNDKCVFSLNLILYLLTSSKQSNIEKLVHFNEIKVVKLSVIISDFSDDFLVFERKLYEYNVYLNESSNNSSNFISIGQINAKNAKNSDFNHLIKYYLGYKNDDDVSFGSLFRVNEQNGDLSLNKTAISTKEGSKYKFYIDAFMQPSAAQKASKTKTRATIQVNLIKVNQDKPRIKVTHLIDTKQLYQSIECIKFTKTDFNLIGQLKKDSQNQSSIALAQIQIETSTSSDDADYFSNEYSLAIESIKPDYLNRSSIQIKIKHLIDNIHVVYLIVTDKSVQYKQLFLTDLYQIKLVLINGNYKVRNSMYVCVNIPNDETTSLEKSSLVQFSQNIYSIYLARSNFIDLYAYDLAEFHPSNLSIFIDSKSTQVFRTQITAVESNSSLTIFRLNVTNSGSSGQIEQLQYEVTGIAFNSDMNSNPVETYKTLSKIGQNENKFLSFACKVLINTELETSVNDSSSFVYDNAINTNEIKPVYKFYTKVDDLLNNSIIGHLPNVYDLKLDNFLTFDSNTIQSYAFGLVNLNEKLNNCFRLNKYDGVLHFIESDNSSQLNCYLKENYPVRLDVVLESESQLINYAQMWIFDVSSKIQNEMINYKNYYEINSNSINLVYDSANNESSRNEFNLNFKLNFDPKSGNASLPNYVRLVSLVSNFRPSLEQKENVVKKNPSVSFSQIDYRTKFEFVGPQLDDLFVLDSKKSSIYLNLTQLGTNLITDKCMSLRLISKNYIYVNSIRRELISFDRFNLNLCFVNDEKRESNSVYLNNLNITYRSLITPILNSDLSSFDYLVKNYAHKNNFFFNSLVWFILLVVVLLFSIFLILTAVYV